MFKVGDIVLAIADNSEFVGEKKGQLFCITKFNQHHYKFETLVLIDIYGLDCCYYTTKFKKATKGQIQKFKREFIVNKLKGVHNYRLEKII